MASLSGTSYKLSAATILLILGLLLMSCLHIIVAQGVGVCYGRNGNDLPNAGQVIQLYKNNGIERMRIYEPNQETLQALRGSNIEVIVGILNDNLQALTDATAATTWVQNNIRAYTPDVKFKYIAVGNEVPPTDPKARYVLPAMQNIHNAIVAANLQGQMKVSTAIDTSLLGASFPPSDGAFSGAASSFITPIIGFLVNDGSPLLANVYPYFSYTGNPQSISLPYALFTAPGTVVTDPKTNLQYQNLFDALVDSLYSALERKGGSNLKIVISESGWPSAGDMVATVENAGTYYRNLINHVKFGTPKRPGGGIETYLFALFDENLKGPAEIEKHFGLFLPNKRLKYNLQFNYELVPVPASLNEIMMPGPSFAMSSFFYCD